MHRAVFAIALAASIAFAGCAAQEGPEPVQEPENMQVVEVVEAPEPEPEPEPAHENEEAIMITVTVGDTTLAMAPADTEAAQALIAHLQEGPVTLELAEYGGFEKVGPLPWSLPRTDSQITTQPGDVVLYQGDQISMFYNSNSWSYTRLGRIEGATEEDLRAAFGSGDITVTLSL